MRPHRRLPAPLLAVALAAVSLPAAHAAPRLVTPPAPLGAVTVGDALRSDPPTFTGDGAVTVAQHWQRCAHALDAALADGAAHLWRLGEATGVRTAADLAGSSVARYAAAAHAVVPGALAGEDDTAAGFDGSLDAVRATGVRSLAGRTPSTIAAWVRPERADGRYRFVAGREWADALGRQGTGLWLHTSGVGVERWRDGVRVGVTAPGGLPAGRWSHVAATYDGSTLRLFVDGRLVGSREATTPQAANGAHPFVIGSLDGGPANAWRGAIDEVAVYGRAVGRAQLAAQVAAAASEPCADVAGAVGPAYRVGAADVGRSLRVVTRATDGDGAATEAAAESSGPTRTAAGETFTVDLGSPVDGATVSGTTAIEARLGGLLPDRVQWLVDGAAVYDKPAEAPLTFAWDTRWERNGAHAVAVRAWRDGGQVTTAEASAAVRNPVDPFAAPLPNGAESAYAELNEGDLPTANDLLADVWPARGFAPPHLGWPLTWRDDPYGDAYWRFVFYGLRPTTHLLWAWETTGRRVYLDRLVAILRSYATYDATRPFDRLSFDNNHAAAYRAMVLVNTYAKLERDGELPSDLAAGLQASLARLGAFLADGRHFEADFNHGFNEALALLLVARRFPALDPGGAWAALGRARLLQMLATNVDADGVDVENSPYYHLYVLGTVGQIADWARAHDPELAATYDAPQRRMVAHLALVTQPDGRLPMLGATATTMVPTQDPNVFGPMTALDDRFAFVMSRGARSAAPAAGAALFPASGLFVLRTPLTSAAALPSQTFVTFDAGAYRTDHSHLDALGLTLYANSSSLLPDSGLFTYDAGTAGAYFRGTRAHNTVVVDGMDQAAADAVPGAYGTAPAGWSWASGTSRLYAGVRHDRTVVVVARGLVLVLDRLEASAPRTFTQTWHLMPGATAEEEAPGRTVARNAAGTPALALVQAGAPAAVRVLRGATAPRLQGWWSNAYGTRQATVALEYDRQGTSARFATVLAAGAYAGSAPTLVETATASGTTLRLCAGAAGYVVTVDGEGAADERVAVTARACP